MKSDNRNMIKEIQNESEISGVNSPLLARVFIAYKYKSGSDNAWRQLDESGNVTALLSSTDGNVTLITTENTDIEEIKLFLSFQKCTTIVSNTPINPEKAKLYALFEFENFDFGNKNLDFKFLSNTSTLNDYKTLFDLVYPDSNCDFDNWFCDFSKRIIKNNAKSVLVYDKKNAVSTATASAVFENSAIISGVYTAEEYRNKGFANFSVLKLVETLKNENVNKIYLWCEKHVETFYKKTGFKIIGNVYIETEF